MTISNTQILAWFQRAAEALQQQQAHLTELDSAIGDGDHGLNMSRGFRKAEEKLTAAAPSDIGAVFKSVGMSLLSSVGGASGPLYGTFFLKAATAVNGKTELTTGDIAAAVHAGTAGIISRGQAKIGDKTMADVWLPVSAALQAAADNDLDPVSALKQAAALAETQADKTIPLPAKKGRASYLGERSIGHKDPGAASSALLLQTLAAAVAA